MVKNSVGIDSSSTLSMTIARIAEQTISSALRMLLAAMTRARSSSRLRDWISAYSGTI